MTIFSHTTKATYDSYAIFKNGTVITGINSEKSIDSLKQTGVPADIVNEYAKGQTDV